MKQWLFMIFLILSVFTHAQKLKFGATGSVGFSVMSFSFGNNVVFDINPRFSWDIGALGQLELTEHSFLVVEGKFTKLKSHEFLKTSPVRYQDGSLHYDEYTITEAEVFYSALTFPIQYRLGLNKLGLKAGLSPCIFVSGKRQSSTSGFVENQHYNQVGPERPITNLSKFNLGIGFGLDYGFSKKWRGRIDSQMGLQNMMDNSIGPFKRKYKQFTIGVDYFIN